MECPIFSLKFNASRVFTLFPPHRADSDSPYRVLCVALVEIFFEHFFYEDREEVSIEWPPFAIKEDIPLGVLGFRYGLHLAQGVLQRQWDR